MEWPALVALRDAVDEACFPRRQANDGASRDVSIHWTTRTLLDLFSEYPGGITRPIAVTELMVRHKQSRHGQVHENDIVATELVQFHAARHTLVMVATGALDMTDDYAGNGRTEMHLYALVSTINPSMDPSFIHQRFERFFPEHSRYAPRRINPLTQPAAAPRIHSTPNASSGSRISSGSNNPKVSCSFLPSQAEYAADTSVVRYLPTDFMVFGLSLDNAWDQGLMQHASCIGSLLQWQLTPPDMVHQQRFRMKIVDIMAARPCVASAALRRQSLVVAPMDSPADGAAFLFVLWDQQALLSQLLEPGDMLIVDAPFLLAVDAANVPEHRAILDEVPAHNRIYPRVLLEYGSSTVIFRAPAVIQKDIVLTQQNEALDIPKEEHTKFANLAHYPYPLSLASLAPRSLNGSFLGLVVDVAVVPASPLLEAFCTKYYAAYTPAMCAVLTLCDLGRRDPPLQIECADEVAAQLLRCARGHVVFVSGVVLVDDAATMRRVVGLCAPWNDVLGVKTLLDAGRVCNWSLLPGFLHSPTFYAPALLAAPARPTAIVRGTVVDVAFVTRAGALDRTCEEGAAVRMVHATCRRPVAFAPPGVECRFCRQSWALGEKAVGWGFGDLLLQLDDGSACPWLRVHDATVERLLGMDPQAFEQAPYPQQRQALDRAHGLQLTGLLSLCTPQKCAGVNGLVTRRLDTYMPLASGLASALQNQIEAMR
ncbi:hypothetical protein ACHHYP_12988 [Achlya hypogyna]|uniref:Uncharacterized protein n=1 Tax=Achlya hypogyna TaxID=1202772 RepID=A0A1V9YGB8_ACHHY|nr:hypothetical protein ACHHYP_12988 [Achlya hypogyna]